MTAIKRETGWFARVDALRMLWYRHIVNFDQRDQISLARTLRDSTASSGKHFRAWAESFGRAMRGWISTPWNGWRALGVGAGLVGAGIAFYFLRRAGLRFRWNRRGPGGGGLEPARAEAGRWISRFEDLQERAGPVRDVEMADAMERLQRLRYGRRENRPDPTATFANARRVFRKVRRDVSRRRPPQNA